MESIDVYNFFRKIKDDQEVDELLLEFLEYYLNRKIYREDVYTNIMRYPDCIYLNILTGSDTRMVYIKCYKNNEALSFSPNPDGLSQYFHRFLIYKVRLKNIEKFQQNLCRYKNHQKKLKISNTMKTTH